MSWTMVDQDVGVEIRADRNHQLKVAAIDEDHPNSLRVRYASGRVYSYPWSVVLDYDYQPKPLMRRKP